MNKRIRVLCIDDNRLVAEAMERRLAFEPTFEWVGWVHDGAEADAAVASLAPDVVLLDIDMPGRDSFELARVLAQTAPDARIIMFSGYVNADYIDRAVEAGAWGYISKNESMSDVLAAISRVAAGEFVLTPDVDLEHRRR